MIAAIVAAGVAAPTMLWTEPQVARVREMAKNEPTLQAMIEWNKRWADRFVRQNTEPYKPGMMLDTSRDVLGKVLSCGVQYRLTGDATYGRRVVKEVVAVAEFPNWHPEHFLDTAEMMAAVGIGLDWCGPLMTPEERRSVVQALRTKGLNAAKDSFARGDDWTRWDNNWAQVCASGMGMAALAIEDEDPTAARWAFARARECLERVERDYLPGGISSEGPVYWRYGIGFQSMYNNALWTKKGERRAAFPGTGFSHTGLAPIYLTGPRGETFNFADASPSGTVTPATFELAREFNLPVVRTWTIERAEALLAEGNSPWREEMRLAPLLIAWWQPGIDPVRNLALGKVLLGKHPVGSFRSTWNDPKASWLAIKGGDNTTHHAHLDVGSFVFEASGVRWAEDLGDDSYGLPGYFEGRPDGRRWTYFRLGTTSHNTLTIGDQNQPVRGRGVVTKNGANWVEFDLSEAYDGQARSVFRTARLEGTTAEIEDRIEGARGRIRWTLMTSAEVELQETVAILTKGGQKLRARVMEPRTALWKLMSAKPPRSTEEQNEGYQRLVLEVPSSTPKITIRLEPLAGLTGQNDQTWRLGSPRSAKSKIVVRSSAPSSKQRTRE